MLKNELGTWGSRILGVLRALPRVLPRLVVIGVLLVAAVVGLLIATASLAAAPLQETVAEMAYSESAPARMLWLIVLWGLVPAVSLIAAGLVYVGATLLLADSALAGIRPQTLRVLGSSARRMLAGLLVALAIVVGVVPLFYFAIRWAFALPEVWLRGASVRDALRSSWQASRGRILQMYVVLGSAVVAVVAIGYAGSLFAGYLPWEHSMVVTQAVLSVALAPIPLILLTVLWRSFTGHRSTGAEVTTGAEGPPAARRYGTVIPAVVSAALVVTLLTPPPPASATETPPSGVATAQMIATNGAVINGALHWELGNSGYLAGRVTSESGQALGGTVTLWVRPEGGVAQPVGSPVPLDFWDETERAGEGVFDATQLGVGSYWVATEYSGDTTHQAVRSAEQKVVVTKPWVQIEVSFSSPQNPMVVGDLITVSAQVDVDDIVPGTTVEGPFSVVAMASGNTIASGTFVDGAGTAQFRLTELSMQLGITADQNEHYNLYSGETVLQAEQGPSSTSVSAEGSARFGEEVTVSAKATGPGGIAARGSAHFEARSPGASEVFDLGSVVLDAQGVAVSGFCVEAPESDAPDCEPDGGLTLPVDVEAVEVRASFVPGDDDSHAPLSSSTSGWRTISLESGTVDPDPDPDPTELCRIISFSNRAASSPHATTPVTDGLGSPRVSTATNCSERIDDTRVLGYSDGTTVVARADAAGGYEFVEWRHQGQVIGTDPVLVWRLGPGLSDLSPQVLLEPVYRPLCVATGVTVLGNGRADAYLTSNPSPHSDLFPDPFCTLKDGRAGAYEGSTVRVSAIPGANPDTGEHDVIYSARVGGHNVSWNDNQLRHGNQVLGVEHTFTYAVHRSVSASVTFGIRCRTVEAPGLQILTDANCSSPAGGGYVVGSAVGVELDPATLEESQVVRGWTVDGAYDWMLGDEHRATITVQTGDATLVGYETIGCYPVEVTVNEARAGRFSSSGSKVNISPAPNCGEENDRWLEGTFVTLTPFGGRNGSEGTPHFSAWTDQVLDESGDVVGERVTALGRDGWSSEQSVLGTVTDHGRRWVTVSGPLMTEASFYFTHACSTISVWGTMSLNELSIPDTGCGPGRYFDASKFEFPADGLNDDGKGITRQMFEADKALFPETTLNISLPNSPVPVQGEVEMSQDSLNVRPSWTWRGSTALNCVGSDCVAQVRGDLILKFQDCQSIDPIVSIRLEGDSTGTVYSAEDFGLEDYPWVTSKELNCGGGAEQWRAGWRVPFEPQSPATGFTFESWGEIEGLVRTDEIKRCDSPYGCAPGEIVTVPRAFIDLAEDRFGHPVNVNFTLACSVPKLQAEVAIVQPAPNCPGATAGNPMYVNGTILHVAANPVNRSGRDFVEFRGNVIPGTIGLVTQAASTFERIDESVSLNWQLDTSRDYPAALVVVANDTDVWGHYQFPDTGWDDFVGVVAKIGKFTVGATALAVTALATLCTPCSAVVAVITVAEVLARVFGADGVANVIAWFNPVYMMECMTKWGFESLPPVSTRQATDAEGVKSGGAVVAGAGVKGAKTFFTNNPSALGTIDDLSASAKVAGIAATVALGVFSHEVYNFSFTGANEADLRDTAAFVGCVTNTYS